MRRRYALFAAAIGIIVSISLARATLHPPLAANTVKIPYQGYLQQNGIPYPGAPGGIAITVNLYDNNAVTPFWHQDFNAVQVNGGHFSLLLGADSTDPLAPGFFNGTPVSGVTVAGPIQVGVTVGGNPLSNRQTLYTAPYAQVAGFANQSADSFAVGTSLSAQTAAISGSLSAGSLTLGGAATVTGNLSATGTLSSGTASIQGDVVATGSLKPQYDSGWFYVGSPFAITMEVTYGWTDAPPSNMMLLECGALQDVPGSGSQPKIGDKNHNACLTEISYAPTRGLFDGSLQIQPLGITANQGKGVATIRMWNNSDLWVWGYCDNGCRIEGDADGLGNTGYWRLLVWK